MRAIGGSLLAFSLLVSTARADDIALTAARSGPTSVDLFWSGGAPHFQVYRGGTAPGLNTYSNVIATISGSSYTDAAATGSLLYYLVTGAHCLTATDCPAAPDECSEATCTQGECGTTFRPFGYIVSNQTPGDCRTSICDGSGGFTHQNEDSDVPVDGNACTSDLCTVGVPTNPPAPDGTPCSDGSCEAGACASTLTVVRVGDGVGALSSSAAPVFLERRSITGAVLSTLSLPTLVNGANQPCTLAGTAASEGGLTRSADGAWLALAAYAASPGIANVSSSTSGTINRVVCRINAAGNVDSSSRLNTAFSSTNVRSATTSDGSAFWVSGGSGGVWYLPLGTTGGTQILTNPSNMRWVGIANSQLYGDSGSTNFTSVLQIGNGLPTTAGQTTTLLPGLPSTGASPYGFVLFDVNSAVVGLDLLYIADDRAVPTGGIQKWTFDGTTWTLVTTFNSGLTASVRGLAAYRQSDGSIALFATTTETSVNRIVRFFDDFVNQSPTATVLATSPTNMLFRGVAISPH